MGKKLITHQRGSEGKVVQRLYIEDGCDINAEYYFSMVIDRVTSRVSIIASTEGGMDIEKVAKETPEKIITQKVEFKKGYGPILGDIDFNKIITFILSLYVTNTFS